MPGRYEKEITLVNYDSDKRFIVEPANRNEFVIDQLKKTIKANKPEVSLKAGVGAGNILLEMASLCKKTVCIESSMDAIKGFCEKYGADSRLKKIEFINGGFSELPIDYYKIDLLVCVDCFDFIQSGSAMEEFKRAIQFEGVFFFAGVVLSDEDVEGCYDEMIRIINPAHNDYYLEGDFRTFMTLKDFTPLAEETTRFNISINEYSEYWKNSPFGNAEGNALKYIEEQKDLFTSLYGFNGKDEMEEIYLAGSYRKNRFKDTPGEI